VWLLLNLEITSDNDSLTSSAPILVLISYKYVKLFLSALNYVLQDEIVSVSTST